MDTPEDRVAAALAPFLKSEADAKAAADAALAAALAIDALRLVQISNGLVLLEARKALSPEIAVMVRCMMLADEEMRANPGAYEDTDDVKDLMQRLAPAPHLRRHGSTH